MNSLSDKILMLQVKDGEVDLLGILFQRHHLALYNFFLRLTSSRELSEDLVQEVFLRMLKYRHTYRGESEFTLWMFQIARNARIDHFRKKRLEVALSDDDELPSHDLLPAEELEQSLQVDLLRAALERLPVEKREVLVLSRFQNLKYEEIAKLLNCAVGTVKARVHRALKDLRDIFFELSQEKSYELRTRDAEASRLSRGSIARG